MLEIAADMPAIGSLDLHSLDEITLMSLTGAIMRDSSRFLIMGVLSLQGLGCSGGTANPPDSGPSIVPDTLPADQAGSEDAPDMRSSADGFGAACRSSPSAICTASTTGFTCPRSTNPTETSICPISNLTTNPNEFLLCCALKPESSSCSQDSTVTCAGNSVGYSCTGADTPAQSNSVICSAETEQGGKKAFCCRGFQSTSCKIDITISGCSQQYPFRCTGTQTPSDVDSGLQCAKGAQFGGSDSVGFCCAVKE